MFKRHFNANTLVWLAASACAFFSVVAVFLTYIFSSFPGVGRWTFGPLVSGVGVAAIGVVAFLAVAGIRLFSKTPWYYQAILIAGFIVCSYAIPTDSWTARAWVVTVSIFIPSLFGGCLAAMIGGWCRGKSLGELSFPIVGFFFSFSALLYFGYWLLSPGTADQPTILLTKEKNAHLPVEDPSLPGPYEVKTLYYGSGKDRQRSYYREGVSIVTEPVDGTPFIKGWEGWSGWLRTVFWGFEASAMPLNAQVWYPEGSGPFPLILVVHGNHDMDEFSDGGYSYLGFLMASQGFIFASVDENFLNTNLLDYWSAFNEKPARGWILLKHLSLWREWNATPGNPFYRKVDMENIGLIGHSRGGEAIVTATAFNSLSFYPDEATVPFNFNFSIRALASIAPKDGQYLPAGMPTPLKNVNFLTMHGSYDGDVRSFEGRKVYSRLVFDDGSYWFKAALYIAGANHNAFNMAWGSVDATPPYLFLVNTKDVITGEQQRKIAKVYLAGFMRAALKREGGYIPLFWDDRFAKGWLPSTLFLSQFEDSRTVFVFADKKDLDITKGTLDGTTITQEGLTEWYLKKIPLKKGGKLDTALYVGWKDGKGSVTLFLPQEKAFETSEDSYLTFSAADGSDFALTRGDPIDFTIVLTDATGEAGSLSLNQSALLPPRVEAHVYKNDAFDGLDNSEPVLQTYRFSLKDFLVSNPRLDLRQLRSVRFLFDKTPEGVTIIDRVGFGANKN